MRRLLTTTFLFICLFHNALGQTYSAARVWNNFVLEAIRNDFARPTIHARNLFHHSVIVYDIWAAFDPSKKTYFLGDTLNGFDCEYNGIDLPADIEDARKEAIAFASYRFIQYRYQNSPDYSQTNFLINQYMVQNSYDVSDTSTQYSTGSPAALGNYIAQQIILYGYTDGSNELNDYQNTYYTQANPPILMSQSGNPNIQDPNRWQPITLTQSIDQSGNTIMSTPDHLSPEWGEVMPFSLDSSMSEELIRDGYTYKVYFNTYGPAKLNLSDSSDWDSFYKWNHTLVSIWQSHLDPSSGVNWDISPASIGNNTWYPTDTTQYSAFYDLINGGDPGIGHALNPITGMPYTPQIVPRGDYTRVLAEFWADGIDSETPPGHWFEIYHYVTDQPLFERKWQGVGPELDTLEYDVKAQLTLAGTMHDAAICAWSLKGYHDYIRPVSAIRFMADQGQSSDSTLSNYHPNGIPLLAGFVETVQMGDPLSGTWNENIGKIKLNTWRGHDYIFNPLTDVAGVGWILAENWWPYQRPTFVTPPFAGFVSGHSTFSRAAAEVMEFMTGSEYFPGGLGEFQANQNQFLLFEEGPSVPITLQWATYRDASDQCSLSRIWGGIHPPVDDIPGRLIGEQVGMVAFNKADSIFSIQNPALISVTINDSIINLSDIGAQFSMSFLFNVPMDTSVISSIGLYPATLNSAISISDVIWSDSLNLIINFEVLNSSLELDYSKVILQNLFTGSGFELDDYSFINFFIVDTKIPFVNSWNTNYSLINDSAVGQLLNLQFTFDEICDTLLVPSVGLISTSLVNNTFLEIPLLLGWQNDSVYSISYSVSDFNETVEDIVVWITNVRDFYQNPLDSSTNSTLIELDTENPTITTVIASDVLLTQADLTSPQFTVTISYSEAMNTSILPVVSFYDQNTPFVSVIQNSIQTTWLDTSNLSIEFFLFSGTNDLISLDLISVNTFDAKNNFLADTIYPALLVSDLKSPEVLSSIPNRLIVSDSLIGPNVYFIDTEFSEQMDTMTVPLVEHFSSQNLTGSIQYNVVASSFIDSLTFRSFFQVLDENIEIDSIHIKIQYAKDFSGNNQIISIDSSFTAIDTKNPSVIGLYANDYVLTEINGLFDVIAVMDEPMYLGQQMNLDFSPTVSLPLILNLNSSAWLNSETFEFNHVLLASPFQVTTFDINLNSGFDLAGNLSNPIEIDDFVSIEYILGINEKDLDQTIVYPTPAKSGSKINFKITEGLTKQNKSFSLINSTGQEAQLLSFNWDGTKFESNPLNVEPGMYYLIINNVSHKIIVFE